MRLAPPGVLTHLGSVDELVCQALGNGLDVPEGGLTGTCAQQPDGLGSTGVPVLSRGCPYTTQGHGSPVPWDPTNAAYHVAIRRPSEARHSGSPQRCPGAMRLDLGSD